jgi:hypothetical protein
MLFEGNRPTHFTAYRLFAWPNFVRKRRVLCKPPYTFYSLSATGEAWLGQTLFEREESYVNQSRNTALFISQPIGCLACQTLFEREESYVNQSRNTALFISQPIGCLACQTLFEREEYYVNRSRKIIGPFFSFPKNGM